MPFALLLRRSSAWMRLACASLALGACSPDAEPTGAGTSPPPLDVGLELSDFAAPVSGRLSVRIAASARFESPLLAIHGILAYDPRRLRYVGQPLDGRTIVLVNATDSVHGRLDIVSVDPQSLATATAELVFEVRDAGYAEGLSYSLLQAGTRSLTIVRQARTIPLAPFQSPPSVVAPRLLTSVDWAVHLGAGARVTPRRFVPGAGTVYGDPTLDGQVDLFDLLFVANLVSGLQPLLTDASKDYVIAANVGPFNLPGLGGPGDAVPPGQNIDGSYSIDLFDLLPIANEVAGYDQPVVGEPIPGRLIPGARAVLSGSVDSGIVRILSRDTVYELHGTVSVAGSGTLVIQSGTRIEGDVGTRGALVVRGGGNIDAQGTRLQPIVFTCNAPVKTRGCWGGIVINGFSLVNNGVILPGGVDVSGCPEKPSIGNRWLYGGCILQDTTGVMRYVRIEYAGMPPAGGSSVPGLALLGVGTGTIIDSIQVHASLAEGIFISGGTAQLRNVVLTDNAGDALRWDDGWVGKAQYVIIQQDPDNGHALSGSNYVVNPGAGPRSAPQLYNVTIAGPTPGMGGSGAGILLQNGTDATIRNAVVLRTGGAGLDIQGVETCARTTLASPGILVEHSVFFSGNPDFASDADCVDEAAYALAPARHNQVLDPGLIAPFNTVTADLRPAVGSPLGVGFAPPPSDGFFDTTPGYIGAVAPGIAGGTNIPWYAGWTRGWRGVP